MQAGRAPFRRLAAGPAEIGRACPYCRFTLKQGVQIAVCGACGAAHHAECWQDNGGCAVIACAGGPLAATPTEPPGMAPTAAYAAGRGDSVPPSPPTGVAAWPALQPPPTPSGLWNPWLAVAIVILAIAVAAVAVLLAGQGHDDARLAANSATTQTVTTPATTVVRTTTTPNSSTTEAAHTGTTPTDQGPLPGVSIQAMRPEIQQVLLEWHEDVVHGSYRAAWELLSRRKQVQDSSEYGYATWVKNQATLRPYLDPAGLQVAIEATEEAGSVARVNVTGMGWRKSGAPCSEWSGITWVRYEEGRWRYDPGYSTTSQREHEWKPRFSELLGGRC
jgi:hypothetical protein